MKSEDFPVEAEEIRQAIAIANRMERGEERVFTFEEAMADLEDAQQGAEALSDASVGSYTGDQLPSLPCPSSEAWLLKNEKAHASVLRGLEQAQRGEFVDPPDLGERIEFQSSFTAVIYRSDPWWIGWVEEVPGVNAQERTREDVLLSLRQALKEEVLRLAIQKEIDAYRKERRSLLPTD